MRLLLDEHFSPEVARQLRARGHEVASARERPELHGLADAELLDVAVRERRAIVTENVADFMELHRRALVSSSHAGIVCTSGRRFPRTRRGIGVLVRALEALLVADPRTDALRDQVVWLERA